MRLPLSATRTYALARPSIATWSRGQRACAPNVLPVRFWHSRQWHIETRTGSPSQFARSCPQEQVATRRVMSLVLGSEQRDRFVRPRAVLGFFYAVLPEKLRRLGVRGVIGPGVVERLAVVFRPNEALQHAAVERASCGFGIGILRRLGYCELFAIDHADRLCHAVGMRHFLTAIRIQ